MNFCVKNILKKVAVCLMPVLLMCTYVAPVTFAAKTKEYKYGGTGPLVLDPIRMSQEDELVLSDNRNSNNVLTVEEGYTVAIDGDNRTVTLTASYLAKDDVKALIESEEGLKIYAKIGNDDGYAIARIVKVTNYNYLYGGKNDLWLEGITIEKTELTDGLNSLDLTVDGDTLEGSFYLWNGEKEVESDDDLFDLNLLYLKAKYLAQKDVVALMLSEEGLKINIKINGEVKCTATVRLRLVTFENETRVVSLTLPKDFAAGAGSLVVTKIEDDEKPERKVPADAIWAYDISLYADGDEIELDADAYGWLTITLPKEYAGQKIKFYHIKDDGTKELLGSYTVGEDGKVYGIPVDSFSDFYAMLDGEEEEEETVDEDAEKDGKDKGSSGAVSTGDASFVLQSVAGLISTGLGLFVIRRKFNK